MKRFWNKVEKDSESDCLNWTASGRGRGYGCFKYKGKVYDSHRFVWFLIYNQWPTQWILHTCHNRKCVSPAHLYEGTPKQNYADMKEAGNEPGRKNKKYFTPEARMEANRRLTLKYWHRRGKYLRDLRRGRIKELPDGI